MPAEYKDNVSDAKPWTSFPKEGKWSFEEIVAFGSAGEILNFEQM
jgi:hypothetical protein